MKKIVIWSLIGLVLVIISGYVIFNLNNHSLAEKTSPKDKPKVDIPIQEHNANKEKEQKDKEYEDCLSKPYKSENLDKEFEELFKNYKNENIGIYFTELNNEYEYKLNPNKIFYSGCTIKIFDAIYYIDKVRSGEFTGNETITYLPQDKHAYSDYMDQHRFYEEIPVTKLLEYMMTISDNAAHFAFIRHYGASNINKYIKEKYNIQINFTNRHPFQSNYTANLANESLKILYNLLKVDDKYSQLIKEAMNNEEVNALNFDDKKFLHKYGELAPYHNDIGIYDSENPYLISILTTYANVDYMKLTSDIHRNIYKIYEKNLLEKENYCKKIYD